MGEFPGGLVVRIPGFHCHGLGSIPGWGTEIPQDMWCGQKKKKSRHPINVNVFSFLFSTLYVFPCGPRNLLILLFDNYLLSSSYMPCFGHEVNQVTKVPASWSSYSVVRHRQEANKYIRLYQMVIFLMKNGPE